MTEIRNSKGKLVCCLDTKRLIVEIVYKGAKTIVYIIPGNKPIVVNSTT